MVCRGGGRRREAHWRRGRGKRTDGKRGREEGARGERTKEEGVKREGMGEGIKRESDGRQESRQSSGNGIRGLYRDASKCSLRLASYHHIVAVAAELGAEVT